MMPAPKTDHQKQIDERISISEPTLTLTPREWDAFLIALDDSERPRPRLARAVQRYLARRNDEGS
ncbi:MAG TPA: DUF397 domain-containing protein [Thermoanaerobaculia bacterium]|nr:DUF397 domain-containing protein [Thermoanaerobaculia bacterium]